MKVLTADITRQDWIQNNSLVVVQNALSISTLVIAFAFIPVMMAWHCTIKLGFLLGTCLLITILPGTVTSRSVLMSSEIQLLKRCTTKYRRTRKWNRSLRLIDYGFRPPINTSCGESFRVASCTRFIEDQTCQISYHSNDVLV